MMSNEKPSSQNEKSFKSTGVQTAKTGRFGGEKTAGRVKGDMGVGGPTQVIRFVERTGANRTAPGLTNVTAASRRDGATNFNGKCLDRNRKFGGGKSSKTFLRKGGGIGHEKEDEFGSFHNPRW